MASRDFLVWGVHSVQATLMHAAEGALELWLKEGALSTELSDIQQRANSAGIATQIVPTKTLMRLSDGAVHQGVVLRRRLPTSLSLADYIARLVTSPTMPLLLVLDQVQDPQNFGACLRVADGAGADAVLVGRDNTAKITGTVAKAASGALDSVPIIAVANLARALDELRRAGMWFVGTAQDGSKSLYECDFKLSLGLVLGGEAHGMRHLTRTKCDHIAHIPMAGELPSLNVSTAAAVALFEAARQRLRHSTPG